MAFPPRVRFAPSPTGYLHIGGARTALFNWLYARRHKGIFVLRMEDTDQERSTLASEKAILDGLSWLSLDWDEGPGKGGPFAPYFQMQRLDTYKKCAEELIAQGKAFRCDCTREQLDAARKEAEAQKRTFKYPGTCRERKLSSGVVRFKSSARDGVLTFDDQVLGTITKPWSDMDDWVMLRADGIPLYNYGCVLDDHLMEISLVVRGQEHINSTFPQLMLYEALGWAPPAFAHLPLILGPDREKLSKRKHPEADLMVHKQNGVMPEALLNYIVRLGWSHGDAETITRDEMIQWFDLDHVGSTSGVWDPQKLLWLNQHYLKTLPVETVAERLLPFLAAAGIEVAANDPRVPGVVRVLRERVKTLKEMAETGRYFFSRGVTLDEKAAQKHLAPEGKALLAQVREALAALGTWTTAELDGVVKSVAEKSAVGMGKVAQPVRVAVTGGTVSPGIGETLEVVGRDETLRRLDAALAR
jgi:glutamyl-tRNA synthetase